MAITAGQVNTTSTLEQFRVEFNKLQTDVSGIEAGSLSFTNISATTISVAELTVTSTFSADTILFEGSTDDDNELIVGFYYGMILKGGSSSAADALSALESAMSSNLLDSLLECEDGNDGRQLRSNSIRRRLRTIALDTLPADAINDEGELCFALILDFFIYLIS